MKIGIKLWIIEGEELGEKILGIEEKVKWREIVVKEIGWDKEIKLRLILRRFGERIVKERIKKVNKGIRSFGNGIVKIVGGKIGVKEKMGIELEKVKNIEKDIEIVGLEEILKKIWKGVERMLEKDKVMRERKEWLKDRER